jgi:tripartite-type tricarboxylate transporter receptor subunit TctC
MKKETFNATPQLSSRRQHLRSLAGMAAASLAAPVFAQSRTTTIVVPFGPGGATDITARMMAEHLPGKIGNPVIVDYKPGANTAIAMAYVRNKAPDGTTLLIVPGAFSSSPATNPKVNNYDPAKDFSPIARLVNTAAVLCASSKSGLGTLDEIMAYAKAKPGMLKVGTTGMGANDHLIPFRMARRVGTDVNFIHYKGSAQAIQDLMSGEIDVKIDSVASFRAALETNRIKPVCMINAGGQTITPNQKSLQEAMGITIHSYFGIVGPAGMPAPMVNSLSKALLEIVQMQELQPRFQQLGIDIAPLGPADFASYMTAHLNETRQVVKEANLPLE